MPLASQLVMTLMIRVSLLVFWSRDKRMSPVWIDCRLCDYLRTFLGGGEPFPTPDYNDGWLQMGSFYRRTAFSIKGGGEVTKHRIIRALQAHWKRWYVTLIPPNFCFWRHITSFWRHITSFWVILPVFWRHITSPTWFYLPCRVPYVTWQWGQD